MDYEKKQRLIALRDSMKEYGYADGVEELESIFPELAKSDDEMMDEIIEYLRGLSVKYDSVAGKPKRVIKEWVAYLEKQNPSFRQINDSVMWDNGLRTGIELGKKEQKPVWSEEDERNIRNLESILYYDKKLPKETRVELGDFLKSLRPQPRKEIYQAAKHDLAIKFMNYLDENRPEGKMSLSNGECEDIDKAFKENDWAKIMRYIEKYRPSWKPSEEQMEGGTSRTLRTTQETDVNE